ncbi:MAG: hypothetical protein AB1515_08080, partial [Nitrospirota bacterium]
MVPIMAGKVKTTRRRANAAAEPRIGTSGWMYGDWGGRFYPEEVKATEDRLRYYARHFTTVEVN